MYLPLAGVGNRWAIFAGWHSQARESELGGEEASGDEGGSPAPEVDHRLQTRRQMEETMWSSGWGLALSRCFFPREAQVGETVPTPSLVISKVPEERVHQRPEASTARPTALPCRRPCFPGT